MSENAIISQANKQNYCISFIRLVAMSFIVLCHFLQYYGNELAWWFNVGVQMFFCISGFLYGKKKIDDPIGFIMKNSKKILIPYFSFLIPCIVLYFICARNYISILAVVKAVWCSGVISGIGHLWFISYILFCYIITPFIYMFVQKIKDLKCIYVLVLFVFVLLFGQVVFYAYKSYFMFSRISCYIIGYFLAFTLKEYGNIIFKRIAGILVVFGVFSNAIRIIFKYVLKQNFFGFALFEEYAHALLGIAIFLIMYIFLKNIKSNRVLQISDKYSYYIYLVHQLLILSPFSLMTVTSHRYLNWVIVILGIFFLAIVLKLISDKIVFLINKIESFLLKYIKNEANSI